MRIDDHVRKTVVFIGYCSKGGPFVPHGTGFVAVSVHAGDRPWQTVVTARHVIEGIPGDVVFLRANNRQGEYCIIEVDKTSWLYHPDDKLDVAVTPCFISMKEFDILHFQFGLDEKIHGGCELNAERIERYQIGLGDEVYITGMFLSHFGEKKNLPIVRIGTIAAMPEEPLQTSYGTHDAFLIEVRSIDVPRRRSAAPSRRGCCASMSTARSRAISCCRACRRSTGFGPPALLPGRQLHRCCRSLTAAVDLAALLLHLPQSQ